MAETIFSRLPATEEILLKASQPAVAPDLRCGVPDSAVIETLAYCLEGVS